MPPDIRGYHFYYNNQTSEKGGTCIYIKNTINAKEIQVETTKDQRHRMTLLETNENIVVEAYAPVNTSLIHIREEFYTALAAAVMNAQERSPNKQIIAMGDFNAHLIGWLSEKTDQSGKLLEHFASQCGLQIIRSNTPTFCRPGKLT